MFVLEVLCAIGKVKIMQMTERNERGIRRDRQKKQTNKKGLRVKFPLLKSGKY